MLCYGKHHIQTHWALPQKTGNQHLQRKISEYAFKSWYQPNPDRNRQKDVETEKQTLNFQSMYSRFRPTGTRALIKSKPKHIFNFHCSVTQPCVIVAGRYNKNWIMYRGRTSPGGFDCFRVSQVTLLEEYWQRSRVRYAAAAAAAELHQLVGFCLLKILYWSVLTARQTKEEQILILNYTWG